ncbi:MAG: hypothetical protein AAF599_05365 [Bacteroidota bacterium]
MPILILSSLLMSKKKNSNTKLILGAAALGLGAYFLFKKNPRFYLLPNGDIVAEDKLRTFGYVQYKGFWFTAEFLNALAQKELRANQWEQVFKSGFQVYQTGQETFDSINRFISDQRLSQAASPPVDAGGLPSGSPGGLFDDPNAIPEGWA